MKQYAPDWARYRYRRLRRLADHALNPRRTPEQVFSRIYAQGQWGKAADAFCSGSSSTEELAIEYARMLEPYVAKHSIQKVVDLGCGDFTIGRKVAALGVDYIGVDVVPALVRHLEEQYARPTVRFVHLDIVDDPLPNGDLCLLRQVLQHLSNAQILKILPKLSQYEHVLITEHYPSPNARVVPNRDKPHGHDTRILDDSAVFLEAAPFHQNVAGVLLEREVTPLKFRGETLRTMRVVTR